jgi:hypothetical protein
MTTRTTCGITLLMGLLVIVPVGLSVVGMALYKEQRYKILRIVILCCVLLLINGISAVYFSREGYCGFLTYFDLGDPPFDRLTEIVLIDPSRYLLDFLYLLVLPILGMIEVSRDRSIRRPITLQRRRCLLLLPILGIMTLGGLYCYLYNVVGFTGVDLALNRCALGWYGAVAWDRGFTRLLACALSMSWGLCWYTATLDMTLRVRIGLMGMFVVLVCILGSWFLACNNNIYF